MSATIESYKLASFRVNKSGYSTEQDPLPVLDPLTGKGYEMKLGKEYLMPRYMENVLRDIHRPIYESQTNPITGEAESFKKRELVGLNLQVAPLAVGREQYLKDHESATLLFSVDPSLVAKEAPKKTAATAKKGVAKGDGGGEDFLSE